MIYKLFIEDGDFIDNATGERRNVIKANTAHTPGGLNVGWDSFDSDASAFAAYNITYDPIIDASIVEEDPSVGGLQSQVDALTAQKDLLEKHINSLIIENTNQITP